jgi:hypothetical protein
LLTDKLDGAPVVAIAPKLPETLEWHGEVCPLAAREILEKLLAR